MLLSRFLSGLMLPTALGTNAWQLYLLAILYFVTAAYAFIAVIRTVAYRFTLNSFRTYFLLLAFSVMMLRCVLVFFNFGRWEYFWLVLFDLLLPLFLQFVT
eukprot:TRINITY_DN9535_c0_g1_i1.p1 TRINITY_DN9535_c0_g1~~TRINITY_DN9535_c0_g1_i1.p1  ORF type:complete len:113 (+),score=18.93 TRINITY_DN9535_c0_g1_i1:38-340(+)